MTAPLLFPSGWNTGSGLSLGPQFPQLAFRGAGPRKERPRRPHCTARGRRLETHTPPQPPPCGCCCRPAAESCPRQCPGHLASPRGSSLFARTLTLKGREQQVRRAPRRISRAARTVPSWRVRLTGAAERRPRLQNLMLSNQEVRAAPMDRNYYQSE